MRSPRAPRRASGRRFPRTVAAIAAIGTVMLALAAGCGGGTGGEGREEGAGDAFRVALLTSGPVSDAGWHAGAYEGLLLIRDSLDAEVRHQQTRSPAEFDEAFFEFGAAGYSLVFAHGFEYQDAAVRAADRFPGMMIVVSGGGRRAGSVVPLLFQLEEAAYLAGMVAGGVTGTGVVGMVAGVATPPSLGTLAAFRAGAEAERPDVRVLESFTGNWDDVAAATEATVAQLRQGADVVIHNVDAAGFGVFRAVREHSTPERPRYAIGMNRDQNDVAPDILLGSAAIDMPRAFLAVARARREGTLSNAPFLASRIDGVVDFIPNPELLPSFPEGLLVRLEEARTEIRAGRREIPRIPLLTPDPP